MVQPTSKRLLTEATLDDPNTPIRKRLDAALSGTFGRLQRLEAVAATDRTASLARSRVDYDDNAGFTEEWASTADWEAHATVTDGHLHAGPGGSNAQRRLPGLETERARIIGTIKVVAAGTAPNFTLFGLTRNQTADAGQMVGAGFFAIGVDELSRPMSWPENKVLGPPLAPGTYGVSTTLTETEIVCTLYSDDASVYYRYSYGRAAWGENYRVAAYNSDSRGAAGNLIGPIAARVGFVSAKPRGTVETRPRWSRYPIAGDNVLIGTPAAYDSRKPQPWVIYAHGYGDTEETVTTQATAMRPVLTALLDAGYGVAAPNFGGTQNWGNGGALANLLTLYRHLRDEYNVGPIVLIGHSMGGLVTLTTIAQRFVPGIVGWVGVEPVVSLASMFNHPSIGEYRASISGAYGVAANGSDYGAKTAGFDPALRNASDFRGVPMLMFASPQDAAVAKAANTDALRAKVQPLQPDVTVVETTGGHVHPSHFQPSAVVEFVDRVTKG